MQWDPAAEKAIKRVPFFVRKRVRARVEREARQAGKSVVTLADVTATQQRYLQNMAAEVKGFQVEACFGPGGCPNRAVADDHLVADIEALMQDHDLLAFLKCQVPGDLKLHHEFRITLAECPNACSQPQIKDIGIIGARYPTVGDAGCSGCEACVQACRESAIALRADAAGQDLPAIDPKRCLACGQCIPACLTGTLVGDMRGFRMLLGGKLGRHPRLGVPLPGLYGRDQVLAIVDDCVTWYKQTSTGGRRFGEILTDSFIERLTGHHTPVYKVGAGSV